MRQITTAQIARLMTEHEPPCVSLYQPTHRHHPDNLQSPIRYRNLVREMETSLRKKYPLREFSPLLEKFQALGRDDLFWNHRADGLAILATPRMFQIFDLQRETPELLVVANSFHLKPLLRMTQSADRYQVLCLDRHEAKLYEGNRDVLDPVELTDIPSTLTDALGEELTEPHLTVASYGKGVGVGGQQMHHGHGAKKDEVDIDRDRFFRTIDRGILDHHSRRSGLPLLLVALPEYHTPFRDVSRNPHLMPEAVPLNPDALTLDQLRGEAWRRMEPLYSKRLAKLVDEYQLAKSRRQGSDDLWQVAAAATAGRVGTLLVEAERQIPGRIQPGTGQVSTGTLADPDTDDALDDLAETTLRMKGHVVIVPAERMPSKSGLAATYRF